VGSSPSTTSALPPGGLGELGWDGDPASVPRDPSSPVLGLTRREPVGKEGSGTQGSPGESKGQQELLHGYSFGGLGGKKQLLHGEQSRRSSGPVRQLPPPAPLALESLFPHLGLPYSPAGFLAKEPTTGRDTRRREMFPRKADTSLSNHSGAGKTEDSTCDSPRRKPKKTRQGREKPKLPGQAAANKHLEQMLSDSLQGGAGKGLTTPTKTGALSAGKPNWQPETGREQDGSGLKTLGKAQEKKHDQRLPAAVLTPDELGEPELGPLERFWQILTCPFC